VSCVGGHYKALRIFKSHTCIVAVTTALDLHYINRVAVGCAAAKSLCICCRWWTCLISALKLLWVVGPCSCWVSLGTGVEGRGRLHRLCCFSAWLCRAYVFLSLSSTLLRMTSA
jgi:hypothetical protein